MDLTKISRNDWIVVAGFIVALVGISMNWYTVSVVSLFSVAVSGWSSGLGVFAFILTLVAAALALVKAVAPSFKLPFPSGLAIMALGGLSAVFVLIKIIDKPGGAGIGYGIGIFIAFIGTLLVVLGGFLKNATPAQ